MIHRVESNYLDGLFLDRKTRLRFVTQVPAILMIRVTEKVTGRPSSVTVKQKWKRFVDTDSFYHGSWQSAASNSSSLLTDFQIEALCQRSTIV